MAKSKKQEAVEAARAELERVEKQVETDRARLYQAKVEVEALSEQVRTTDPDDGSTFAALVTKRDAARGRVEALEARLLNGREAAELRLRKAEAEHLEEQLAVVDAELKALERKATADALAVEPRFKEYARTAGALAERAYQLEVARAVAVGEPAPPRVLLGSKGRGNYWPLYAEEHSGLKAAAKVVEQLDDDQRKEAWFKATEAERKEASASWWERFLKRHPAPAGA